MRATVAVLAVPVLVATAFSPPPPQCAPRARSRLAMQMQTGVGAEGGARRATSRRHVLGRGAAAMGSAAAAAVLGVPRVSGAFDVEGFAEQVRKREDLIQKLDREKALPGGHSERVQAWLRRQSVGEAGRGDEKAGAGKKVGGTLDDPSSRAFQRSSSQRRGAENARAHKAGISGKFYYH